MLTARSMLTVFACQSFMMCLSKGSYNHHGLTSGFINQRRIRVNPWRGLSIADQTRDQLAQCDRFAILYACHQPDQTSRHRKDYGHTC